MLGSGFGGASSRPSRSRISCLMASLRSLTERLRSLVLEQYESESSLAVLASSSSEVGDATAVQETDRYSSISDAANIGRK